MTIDGSEGTDVAIAGDRSCVVVDWVSV